jgi:tetratricopeptide (TPR) repeat protein
MYENKQSHEAEPFATKAVETFRLLPEQRNPLRMYLDTLACIHSELGKYSEAEKEYMECLEIAEELYSQDKENNVSGFYNELKELSFLYYEMKDPEKFNLYKAKALHYYDEMNEEVKKACVKDYIKLKSLL